MSSEETFPSDEGVYYCEDEEGVDQDGENRHSGGNIRHKYDAFRQYLISKGFEYVGYGSFRATYKRGKVVVKVPRNGDGEVDNRVEARAWHKYKNNLTPDGVPLAPCRLLSNGCLMMVAVVDTVFEEYDDEGAPPWMRFIEGWQIGVYREKLVAYDYALDIHERPNWEKEWGIRSEYFNEELR